MILSRKTEGLYCATEEHVDICVVSAVRVVSVLPPCNIVPLFHVLMLLQLM